MSLTKEIKSISSLKIQYGAVALSERHRYRGILFLTEIVTCVSMATLGFPAAIISGCEAIILLGMALGLTFHYNEES